jgi:hypothetical protein
VQAQGHHRKRSLSIISCVFKRRKLAYHHFGWFGGVLAGLGLLVHCESACQDGERRGQESPWRVKGLFDTRESSWVRWLEILTFAIAEVCLQLRPTKSFRHVTVELDLKQESRVCNLSCFLTKYATSGPAQR